MGQSFKHICPVDDSNDLYIHLISGFYNREADRDYMIEICYDDYKKFITIKKGDFIVEKIGKYKKGHIVKGYYEGAEVLTEFLGYDVNKFRELNRLTNKSKIVADLGK